MAVPNAALTSLFDTFARLTINHLHLLHWAKVDFLDCDPLYSCVVANVLDQLALKKVARRHQPVGGIAKLLRKTAIRARLRLR
jgi:hypothetical protein